VTGGKDAKELGAVLDVILPEDVRERIDGLRKERHMRIKAVICKKSRMVPEVRVRVPPAKRLPINSKRYSTASVLFAINGG
jgi:hypothetical protein